MTRRHPLRPLILRALIDHRCRRPRAGLTLVEMLVAMAITLLIMGAVVTVFANISGSVTRRRATIEMSSALRNVRETLARDLAGATCPAIPWQRPESNHGYLEIIEGPQNDYYPTPWLWDGDGDGQPEGFGTGGNALPGIDLSISSLPGSNLERDPLDDVEGRGLALGSNAELPEEIKTDGRGLGDADDILMLTVRNEKQPFVGRIPKRKARQISNSPATYVSDPASRAFPLWDSVVPASGYSGGYDEVESPLAEVVWFAVENPVDPQRTFAFGEPGYRTIHRRALLILPELDYGIQVSAAGVTVAAAPGTVRVLTDAVDRSDVSQAIASLIAFQDRYDLSVRLEWDESLPSDSSTTGLGRWVLRANSLGDLTERENRYEHHGYVGQPNTYATIDRYYPFAVASAGNITGGEENVIFVTDPEIGSPAQSAEYRTLNGVVAYLPTAGSPVAVSGVVAFTQRDDQVVSNQRRYALRPFAVVNNGTDLPCTARAILDEDGHVVHVTRGLAPLGGARRGDDVMMTDALSFDLRVYDPGAPIYSYFPGAVTNVSPERVLEPGDPAWGTAYLRDLASANNQLGDPVLNQSFPYVFERQGAYVDLGYGRRFVNDTGQLLATGRFAGIVFNAIPRTSTAAPIEPRFAANGLISLATSPNSPLTTAFGAYDTWSQHYEADGVNQDLDDTTGLLLTDPASNGIAQVDEWVNGLDDPSAYDDNNDRIADTLAVRFGSDDYAERETRPPYDSALRGMQVTLRSYERDSRQIREVNVRESFVPE